MDAICSTCRRRRPGRAGKDQPEEEEEEENDEWGGTADYDRNGGATTASSSRTVLRISAQDRSTVLVNVSGWPLFFFVGFANRIFMEQLL